MELLLRAEAGGLSLYCRVVDLPLAKHWVISNRVPVPMLDGTTAAPGTCVRAWTVATPDRGIARLGSLMTPPSRDGRVTVRAAFGPLPSAPAYLPLDVTTLVIREYGPPQTPPHPIDSIVAAEYRFLDRDDPPAVPIDGEHFIAVGGWSEGAWPTLSVDTLWLDPVELVAMDTTDILGPAAATDASTPAPGERAGPTEDGIAETDGRAGAQPLNISDADREMAGRASVVLGRDRSAWHSVGGRGEAGRPNLEALALALDLTGAHHKHRFRRERPIGRVLEPQLDDLWQLCFGTARPQ